MTAGQPTPHLPLRAMDVHRYRICEEVTEGLIYAMLIFSPWAFGTTQEWAMWAMNVAGYALGLLFLVKVTIRRCRSYRPSCWDDPRASRNRPGPGLAACRLSSWLAGLTLAILAYCLVSAVNARSTFIRDQFRFEYHDYVQWLPHSLDSQGTWFAFWTCLGLACSFWAISDWLPGLTSAEERARHQQGAGSSRETGPFFPARLRRLLWVLCANGALLGLEAVVQRLEGSGRLLWLVQPQVNPGADAQFGPWAYRANAAQYFNLLWPVCLGFWWTLHRSRGASRKAYHLLLLCGVIMAACPIVSTSRGGALISVGIILTAALAFLVTEWMFSTQKPRRAGRRRVTYGLIAAFFAGALLLSYFLGWGPLKPRLRELGEGFVQREQMYDMARPMAADYPLFGTGPGTFESLFQIYRSSPEDYWPAQLHNDWLETRITFGWVGSLLLGASLLIVGLRWFAPGGIHGGRRFVILLWLALAGCLAHARFDFPFQVHSVLFLFLVLCAVLFNVARRATGNLTAEGAGGRIGWR